MEEIFNTIGDLKDRGFSLEDPPLNIVCYDPAGDGDDNDAVVILSREEWRRGELHDPDLAVEMIFRLILSSYLPNDMEFPDKLAALLSVNNQMLKWQRQKRQHAHVIGVETNGVGYAMASSLRTKTNVPVIGYNTVGNMKDRPFEGKDTSMPRLAALDNFRVYLEMNRIKILKDCVGKKDMVNELNSFVWAAKGRPEAMAGARDDLTMAAAGALWIGTKLIPPINKQVRIDPRSGIRSHLNRTRGNMRMN